MIKPYSQLNYRLLLLFLLTLYIVTGCSFTPPHFDEEEWRQKVEATNQADLYAPHFKAGEGVFFNPWLEREELNVGTFDMLRYFFAPKPEFPTFSAQDYAAVPNDYTYLNDNTESITFAGHASFIVKMDGQTIMTDPFYSGRALILGSEVDINFNWAALNEKPVVLISHNHYDHLDEPTVKKLIKKDATFIVPLKLGSFFTELGAPQTQVHELDWWESVTVNGIKYTFVPAQHWSRRLWQPQNSTLWGGFVFEGSKSFYFSGDTGYFKGFKAVGERFPALDYAFIAAGVHEPRWLMHYAHQNVEEFFKAVSEVGAKTSIPMHFGVIELGKEDILYPLHEVSEAVKNNPAYRHSIAPLRVGELLYIE